MAAVVIGVDPHKGSRTAVVIDQAEAVLGQVRVRACAAQVERLLAWAADWPQRTWAVEGAGGVGHLLATGATSKNDPDDALSVGIAALRSRAAAQVRPDDHAAVLKIWAKRHRDLSRARNQIVCRLHAVLCDLIPGGVCKHISAALAARVLERAVPSGAVQAARHQLAAGNRTVFRLSLRGNRRLNHAVHMAAVTQISDRGSEGRAYYDKKVAEGKTPKEALRALKRKVSDAFCKRLKEDAARTAGGGPGGHPGNDTDASAAGSHPGRRLFGQATPGPGTTLRPRQPPEEDNAPRHQKDPQDPLTQRGLRSARLAGARRCHLARTEHSVLYARMQEARERLTDRTGPVPLVQPVACTIATRSHVG